MEEVQIVLCGLVGFLGALVIWLCFERDEMTSKIAWLEEEARNNRKQVLVQVDLDEHIAMWSSQVESRLKSVESTISDISCVADLPAA